MPSVERKNKSFSAFMAHHRLLVLLVVLLGSAVFTIGLTRMKSEVILADMFPHDHPYIKLHAKFSEVFGGGGSGVIVAVKAKQGDIFNTEMLGKIKKITEEIVLWEEVYRLLTVSIASSSVKVVAPLAKGEIQIEPLMWPFIPEDEEGIKTLKTNIFSSSSYDGTLVSGDGTAGIILTEMKENITYAKVFTLFRDIVSRYSDENTSIHIVGFPMLMGWIYSYKIQILLVFGISVALMLLILLFIFRSVMGMVAPVAMSLICTWIGLGFIGWTGINFSPLLYVLAFLIGARMLSNAVQITHRFIEEAHLCRGDKQEATRRTIQAMLMPNAAAVATDVVGFLVIGLAEIVLMQQLAVIMSFWMLTILLEGVLVPIICSYLPLRIRSDNGTLEDQNTPGWLGGGLKAVAGFSMGTGKHVVGAVVLAIIVFGAWQILQLKVGDPTAGSPILWPDHTYNQDQLLINELFDASSENFVLYYEGRKGSVYDPVVLTTFEKFSQHMAENLTDLYRSSSSIIDMGKMLTLTFHDGDQSWYQLPRNDEALMGILGYLRNNVGAAGMSRYIDKERQRAQITLFFSDHTSDNILRIRDAAFRFFEKHPSVTDNGEFKLAGGRIGMEIALNEEMKRTHALMDLTVLVAIFVMVSLVFRSFMAGVMLTVPLILSNLIALSYMAVANIGLSTNTLPCSAVGVGVGVDFALYLYARCVEEFPHQKGWKETVLESVRTTGKGIVFTGVTLILPILTWYFISDVKFQAQMGFFLSMLLLANMIAAFTVHPLLIMICKPSFMKRMAEPPYNRDVSRKAFVVNPVRANREEV